MSSAINYAGLALVLGKILWVLLRWYLSKDWEREKRAKELSALLAQITKKGDNLGKQIQEELNSYSDVKWDDIKVREG